MNPYTYVYEATKNGESLLSLCCGIGLELRNLATKDVTAVDIAPQYLEVVRMENPHIKTIQSDTLEFAKQAPDNSFDVVSIIDGIEHMDKKSGLELIPHLKRIAKKEVLLFTPQGHNETGYLKNEPHNAWGITGADHFQQHKSGWTAKELEDLGFDVLATQDSVSQHGEPYTALMFIYRK